MEDLNKEILKDFLINPDTRVIKERSAYVISVFGKLKLIRKTSCSTEHIRFQHFIKEKLYDSGFYNINRYYDSINGEPYVSRNKYNYVMTDYLGKKNIDFKDNLSFKRFIVMVSRMHSLLKTSNMKPVSESHKTNRTLDVYKRELEYLERIRSRVILKKRLSDFDIIFLKNYEYYTDKIKKSIAGLEASDFYELREKAVSSGSIVHNYLKEEYIYNCQDELVITNFSNSSYDIQLLDLTDLILRYVKKSKGDMLSLKDIMELYSSYIDFGDKEEKILFYLLNLPVKFINICKLFYKKNRTFTPVAITKKIDNIVQSRGIIENYTINLYN
jgi:CotS family spore coat protein